MDAQEEEELIKKGLRMRYTVRDARTYIVDENGNEIEQPKEKDEDEKLRR